MDKASSYAKGLKINSPLPTNLAGECKKATNILNSFVDPGQGMDKIIPPSILEKAEGLAIYTVIKAGFLFSARAGSGIVVAKLPGGGWSAPCAIGTGGIGAGGQIGAELTDFVLVLNTKSAVKTFSQGGNVTLGGNVSIAAGPIGRNAEASGSANLKSIAAVYSYSKTKGLFAGVSLEGSVVVTRGDANEKLYGQRVTPGELLNGSIPPPPEADSLYRALNAKFHTLGNQTYGTTGEKPALRIEASRSPNISAPGTLRQPPPPRQITGGYGAPLQIQNQPYGSVASPPPQTTSQNYNHTPPPPSYSSGGGDYKQNANPQNQYNSSYSNNNTNNFAQQAAAKRAPPPPPASRKPVQEHIVTTARALYQYAGTQAGDLSFNEGDVITIIEKTDSQDDWWTGSLHGREGIFPANYVALN